MAVMREWSDEVFLYVCLDDADKERTTLSIILACVCLDDGGDDGDDKEQPYQSYLRACVWMMVVMMVMIKNNLINHTCVRVFG